MKPQLQIVPEHPTSSPHDVDLEASTLGSFLQNQAIPASIGDRLKPDLFFDHRHRLICETMLDVGADPISVAAQLFGERELATYSASLLDLSLPLVGQERQWIERLEVLAAARVIESEAMIAVDLARSADPAAAHRHIQEAGEKPLGGPTGAPVSEPLTFGAAEYIERARAQAEGNNPGWKTGIGLIDQTINKSLGGGIQPGGLGVIAGRPGRGKTTFLVYLLYKILDIAGPAAPSIQLFSLEMTRADVAQKFLSIGGGAASDTPPDIEALEERYKNRSARMARLWVHDGATLGVDAMIAEADRLIGTRNNPARVFAVDYLQRIPFDSDPEFLRIEFGRVTRKLAVHARDRNVAWILLSQFNRQAESETRDPNMADLKDSGDIEQDSSWVLACHRPVKHEPSRLRLFNLKNRFGPADPYQQELLVDWAASSFGPHPNPPRRPDVVGA